MPGLKLWLVYTVSTRLQQNAALFTPVGWRRRKATGHRGKTPFLNIRLDEHETHLAKVDVDGARTIGANCGKEILCFEVVGHLFQLLSISREEYASRPRPVSNANNIALHIFRTVWDSIEWLIVSPMSAGQICQRRFVEAFQN